MRINFLFIFILSILSYSCAKQGAPMGGPQDRDPPQVISMNPKDQSLNSKPEKITITFNEYIKLDNPNKNIIITPRINKDEVVISALKNALIIDLNQELEENTTYVFNFQKSVQDLSEGNPAENLKLVFSTGSSIDSLTFSGQVNYYFPKSRETFDDIIIGLYLAQDSTDIFTAPPYYLSQADSSGKFMITNIKSGNYRAYAWKDDNNSLKAESKSEVFDFINDTIPINSPIAGVNFNLSGGDQTPIKLIRSSPSSRNYDLVLNRDPVKITLDNPQLGNGIFYTTSEKRIRLYSEKPVADSLKFNILLQDSVGFTADTTIYAKFLESERRPEKLTVSANSGKGFYRSMNMELTFNKPIVAINTDSLYLTYDTATRIPITSEMMSFRDSLTRNKLLISVTLPDTITKETITLKAADSTFRDIEGMYNAETLNANYRNLQRDKLADEISGRILGAEGPFIVQLMDSKGELYRQTILKDGNSFKFSLIEPGNYQIRVIADKNGNNRWDPANVSKNQYAEQVFYYKDENSGSKEIVVRAGWTAPDQIINASQPTGLRQEE